MWLKKTVPVSQIEGWKPPWWLGVCYFHVFKEEVVFYPIPLNVIIRKALRVWWWLSGPPKKLSALEEAYAKGRRDGYVLAVQQRLLQDAVFRVGADAAGGFQQLGGPLLERLEEFAVTFHVLQ